MFDRFEYLEKYPAMLIYTFYKDSVYFDFALSKTDTIATWTSNKDVALYKMAIQENIKQIENTNFLFKRNADIALSFKKYFQQIQIIIKQDYFYPQDLKKYGYSVKVKIIGFPRDTIINNYKILNVDNLLLKRQELVNYHNELIKSKKNSLFPIVFVNNLQFHLGAYIFNRFVDEPNKKIVKITDFNNIE